MQPLNLPSCGFRLKSSENKVLIFDVIRKKFVVLQPEEWVRQHVVHFLMKEKEYPISHINVEKQLKINGLTKRYDIVVYNPNGSIEVLVECKAPKIKVNQTVFDQIARYNMQLQANYLMVTNGLDHYYCQMNLKEKQYTFLQNIPNFNTALKNV